MRLQNRFFQAIAAALCLLGPASAQIRPAASDYKLVVETEEGASVSLDGKSVCSGAPAICVVRNPKPGVHLVRVEHAPCTRPFTETVTVIAGQSSRVRAKPAAITSSLQVFSTPGAEITIDGKRGEKVGKTGELTIAGLSTCVTHKVVANLTGFIGQQSDITVMSNVVSTVTMELKKNAFSGEDKLSSPTVYQLHRRLTGPSGVEPIAVFRADGQQVITWTRDDERVMVWDPATGRQLSVLAVREKQVLAASSDLQRLAVAPEPGVVQILNIEDGKEIRRFRASTERVGPSGYVSFSSNGRRLVVVSERTAGLWDIENGTKVFSFPQVSSIGHPAFRADGREILMGNEGVTLWDAETGVLVRQFPSVPNVRDLALSPDGRWFAIVLYNQPLGRWQSEIRDLASGQVAATLNPDDGSFNSIAFTSDSKFLLSANSDSTLRIWDVHTGREISRWPAPG